MIVGSGTDLRNVGDTEVTLAIGGNTFRGWSGVTIQKSIDAFSQFAVSVPFDPSRGEIRRAFTPFSYERVQVYIGRELVLTGTMELIEPSVNAMSREITVQGRSIPGVLVDCHIGSDGDQWWGLSLQQLATEFCRPFSIDVVLDGDDAYPSDEIIAEPGKTFFSFLQQVADANHRLITDDETGRLVILTPQVGGEPVASITEGQDSIISFSASYNGAKRFSKYTILSQAVGLPDMEGTASDPHVQAFRPFVKLGGESVIDNIEQAAIQERGLALASSFALNISVIGWHTGRVLWDKGQIVTVKIPSVFIDSDTPMLISAVKMTIDAEVGQVSELTLVPPETYTEKVPEEVTEGDGGDIWYSERDEY
jgi:prophage tail gpP-like protein